MIPVIPHNLNTITPGAMNADGFYVPNGSSLIVSIRNTNAVTGFTVFIKGMATDMAGNYQPIEKSCLLIPSDASEKVYIQPLMEGWVQSVQAFVQPAFDLMRGQCFVTISVKLGAVVAPTQVPPLLVTLASDYIETLKPVSFPGSGVTSSTAGRGLMKTITTPIVRNAGVISYVVPDNLRQKFHAVLLHYANILGGAAQTFQLQLADKNGVPFWEHITHAAQAANTACDWSLSPNYPIETTRGFGANFFANEALPREVILVARNQFNVFPSTSPQAGDAGFLEIRIEEWIEARLFSDPP